MRGYVFVRERVGFGWYVCTGVCTGRAGAGCQREMCGWGADTWQEMCGLQPVTICNRFDVCGEGVSVAYGLQATGKRGACAERFRENLESTWRVVGEYLGNDLWNNLGAGYMRGIMWGTMRGYMRGVYKKRV